ncbi:MAG TPA: UDP-N-acetylglucosamine 2-epimerase [Acidimicrobiia bacterium]
MSARRVAVFTSSRSDLAPLAPVIRGLDADPGVEMRVLISGTHVSQSYGRTRREIDVPLPQLMTLDTRVTDDDTPGATAGVVGRTTTTASRAFDRWRPDLLVVLGDRSELLGVAAAAVVHRVPLVHISGGEITEGATDDAVRHAITKLAHLHCCACEEYAARIRSMGEEPWRVHVTGDPAIDRLVHDTHPTRAELVKTLGVQWRTPVGLLTYHPPTLDPERLDAELDALLTESDALPTVIATYPGADPGASRIIDALRAREQARDGFVVVESLGRLFPTALSTVDVMLGNSSSGIVEAMSFSLPVVNVGDRQRGRLRGPNVLDASGDRPALRGALARALDPGFRAGLRGAANPYGDGKAAARIVDAIVTAPLDQLLHKTFVEARER